MCGDLYLLQALAVNLRAALNCLNHSVCLLKQQQEPFAS